MMKTKKAFTLAEVLITLGIIGVVAAMTIPTLISNTNGVQFKTAYKKALSTLNQAVLMNLALDDTDFSSLVAEEKDADKVDGSTNNSMSYLLKNRMQSATNISADYNYPDEIEYHLYEYICTTADTKDSNSDCYKQDVGTQLSDQNETYEQSDIEKWPVFSFADGTAFGYNPDAEYCQSVRMDCVGFIDANGITNPNKVIECDDTDTEEAGGDCSVAAANITDIYPVFIHGQTVEPASNAARAVLFGK